MGAMTEPDEQEQRTGQRTEQRGAFSRAVFPDGEEPDPRFTLANERTFLAWTRTSLAFLAGGIALEAFEMPTINDDVRRIAALVIIVIGMLIALGAAIRWVRVERAMRHAKPLPAPAIAPVLGVGIFVAALIVLVALL
ncbi:Inner membrane protein YidH [Corynebacterium cystitidis DSM 20524]|uniref:Putative membrane protein n=2 Tax=Corynebacterium cystitidis TaxID=35757 RepID=A0A1H9UYU9_9CORY|nr:Inner membrane protein YidH [Corynebacterium cystitidis DSM 20524]SES14193.1 putative membrane protein [Corynebacterium cystitidis DSM 20524]SNV91520.1 predicted membrane protein [Corynebacterium cystitidis]